MAEAKTGLNKAITISLLFSTQAFSYMIRFALGVAAPTLMKLYHLSPKTMGYVLSGWNWSYMVGLPFIGPIIDRFGPYIVMTVGSAIWALSTIALPIATGAASLFAMRVIFGIGQTVLVPSGAIAVARVFSIKERTRVIAIAFAGNQVGLAIAATVASVILSRLGWRAVFYVIGAASMAMTLSWAAFYPDKRIGKHLAAEGDAAGGAQVKIPWLALFESRSTWGIAFGQMGYLYAYYFFVSWLPAYLVMARNMTLLKSGIVAALPFWVGMIGTLAGGWIGDSLIKRGVSTTVSRKSIIGVGLTASTVLVIAAAYVAQSWLAVTLLTLCVGFLRLATGSANSLPIDLAPRHMVGSLTAIQNCFGNIGGLLAPIVTGYIVSATGSFINAFVVAGAMALFGAISFVLIMGKVEGNAEKGPNAPPSPAPILHTAPSGTL